MFCSKTEDDEEDLIQDDSVWTGKISNNPRKKLCITKKEREYIDRKKHTAILDFLKTEKLAKLAYCLTLHDV